MVFVNTTSISFIIVDYLILNIKTTKFETYIILIQRHTQEITRAIESKC